MLNVTNDCKMFIFFCAAFHPTHLKSYEENWTAYASVFKDLGNGRYQANGSLSLRGISKPVALVFSWKPKIVHSYLAKTKRGIWWRATLIRPRR